jgi:glycosyltransferase involved in cell wall biosynthesis
MNMGFAMVAWSLEIPAVRTIHSNFLYDGALRWKKIFERWLGRKTGLRQIAISESVKQNEVIRLKNPTTLCWNWIDSRKFHPPEEGERAQARLKLGLPENRRIIVSVGNGADVKNYSSIIQALAELRDDCLLYCQVGHPHDKGHDAQVAADLSLQEQVLFMGPRTNVIDWLWAADLYVMPSLYEGFGLAAAEALASGCKCIFSDCSGLLDFKTLGADARWVRPTATHLAAAIKSDVLTPLCSEAALHNAALSRKYFSPEAQANAYAQIWTSLYKASNPSYKSPSL